MSPGQGLEGYGFRPEAGRRHAGFTLVEILVVLVIILLLLGILVPAIIVVKRTVDDRQAATVIKQLVQGMEAYRLEDRDRSYPTVNSDLSLSRLAVPGPGIGNLGQLEARGAYVAVEQGHDPSGCLLDPWGEPYRYSLVRPAPTMPVPALNDWNWDAAANRVRAWGSRLAPNGVLGDGALPFAYVWSLGRKGTDTDATHWIYHADARP